MTKKKTCICIERRQRHRSQQGDALFEALIGFVLLMVLGLGLSYAAARALNSQRYASTQNIALNQMRSLLRGEAPDSSSGSSSGSGVRELCAPTATRTIDITPASGDPLKIPVTASNCVQSDVTVGVAGNAALNVTLKGNTTNSVYTRMSLGTTADNDNARNLLGSSSTVLSQ